MTWVEDGKHFFWNTRNQSIVVEDSDFELEGWHIEMQFGH